MEKLGVILNKRAYGFVPNPAISRSCSNFDIAVLQEDISKICLGCELIPNFLNTVALDV